MDFTRRLNRWHSLHLVSGLFNESNEKGHLREEDRYKWGCGRRPHPHLYPSLLLAGGFFSVLIQLDLLSLVLSTEIMITIQPKNAQRIVV
jgi:hypothetical protein